MEFAPHTIKKAWIEMLTNEACPLFAQVATVCKGLPQVRTVHLRYLEEYETFGFNIHVRSAKWIALNTQPVLAGCCYDRYANRQFRWGKTVRLLEGSLLGDLALLERLF